MNKPMQLATGPVYHAEKPVRDYKYRLFIKNLPCLACLKTWNVDPCHTGPRGLGQKTSDLACIPLCRKCHDQFDADPYGFAETHGIDIPARIKQFNEFYAKLKGNAA